MKNEMVKAGERLISIGQPVEKLILITKGRMRVDCPGGSYEIGGGDIAGICEVALEIHIMNYTAMEDIQVLVYPLPNVESIRGAIGSNPNIARIFIRSMIRQISSLMNACQMEQVRCNEIFRSLKSDYKDYITDLVKTNGVVQTITDIEELDIFLGDEDPDYWLAGYYEGLNRIYAGEHSVDFVSENDVTIGMLRKGSLDARKSVTLLAERYSFVKKCLKSYFLYDEVGLFGRLLELYGKLAEYPELKREILEKLDRIINETKGIKSILDDSIIKKIEDSEKKLQSVREDVEKKSEKSKVSRREEDIYAELLGSLDKILEYSELSESGNKIFRNNVHRFVLLQDKNSMEDEAVEIRRALTRDYYDIYTAVSLKALVSEEPPLVVKMFLYFGYVDETLAGRGNLVTLYEFAKELTERKTIIGDVYPFFDWLKAIYRGEKEPSRNEFDVDYADYIRELKHGRKITEAEAKEMDEDRLAKVMYELDNLLKTGNKITFGRISTFCPIFCEDNLFKDISSCFLRADEIVEKLTDIKKIDYSAFYRETLALGSDEDMSREFIHVEKTPDFILMPNAGVRGSMWQEIEGRVRTSKGRMLLSIFHMEDLFQTMIRLTAEFRWELCKRIQGGRWNDISDPSLTSLYCDYVQFYRRNSALSPEMKEKIKLSLQRAKNSFKEMFVRDYSAYLIYEGKGSPHLNKVVRQILFAYCPFDNELMSMLEKNPLFAEHINLHRLKMEQKLYRLAGLERKILKKKGEVPEALKREIEFVKGSH